VKHPLIVVIEDFLGEIPIRKFIAIVAISAALGLCGLIAQEPQARFKIITPVFKARWSIEGRNLDWFSEGNPLNNQCPVCGTMAEPYHPTELKRVFIPCPKTALYFDKTGSGLCEDWKLFPVEGSVAGMQRLNRCKRCNCAFWQDAEPDKAVQP
jgi:hypothetical protein